MSDAESALDDRDDAVWQAIGGDEVDAAELSHDELVRVVEQMAADFVEYRARTNQEIAKLHNRISDIGRKADGQLVSVKSTTLGKYASMGEANRRELLGKTDRLAVLIYDNWDAFAEELPNGKRGVSTRRNSTRKYNPSRFKRQLEDHVSADLLNRDGELPWSQVHRAMMAVASSIDHRGHRDRGTDARTDRDRRIVCPMWRSDGDHLRERLRLSGLYRMFGVGRRRR